jgi:hypothetical protein
MLTGEQQSGRAGRRVLEQVLLQQRQKRRRHVDGPDAARCLRRAHDATALPAGANAPATTSLVDLAADLDPAVDAVDVERRSSSSSPWRRRTNAARTMSNRRRSGMASLITAISSREACTATRLTGAEPAPRFLGGARSISSSSSADWSRERSSR